MLINNKKKLLKNLYILFLVTTNLILICNYSKNKKKIAKQKKEKSNNISIPLSSINDNLNMPELAWTEIINNSYKAVVCIIKYAANFNWIEPYKTPQQTLSIGTGFFINNQGYLITNFHVIDQAAIIYAQAPHLGKQRFNLEIVAIAPERDIALLKLTNGAYQEYKELNNNIHYLKFGNSDLVVKADEISTLGFPLGQEFLKSTTGSVSGIQTLDGKNFIQIDAPINPGNSGGPSFNKHGLVIGINTAGINTNGSQNIGYIIPMKEILIFLHEVEKLKLLTPQESYTKQNVAIIRNPLVGMRYQGSTKSIIEYHNNPLPGGPFITEIIPNGLGDQLGLQVGDMIYNINDLPVDRFGDLNSPWTKEKISIGQYLYQLDIGSPLKFTIYRNGKEIILTNIWQVAQLFPIRFFYPPHETIDYIVISGMVLMPLTTNHLVIFEKTPYFHYLQKYDEMKNTGKAKLIITHILPNSIAEKARFLHPGMVIEKINDTPVGTIEECNNALFKSLKNNFLTISLESGEFFAGYLNDILKEEKFLSQFYNYHINATVEKLILATIKI